MPVILQAGDLDLIPAGGWLPTLPPTQAIRLAQLTTAWLAAKKSVHTRTNYRRDLQAWFQWCDGCGIGPLEARIMYVDAWIARQREHGVGDDATGKPAAEASISRRVATVSSWYNYLIRNTAEDDEPLMTHNPANTDARPDVDPDDSPTIGLSRQEADQLIAQADDDGPATSALIRLLLLGGLRCGSVVSARVEHLGHDQGHRILTVTAKRGKKPRVVIPPVLGAVVDAMLAQRGDPTEGPLFLTPSGKTIYESYVFRLVRRLARRAGIKAAGRLSPHSLRHTAITEMLNATHGDLRRTQDFAGHADPRTTRRYDRKRNNLDDHGAYVLAAHFGQSEGSLPAER